MRENRMKMKMYEYMNENDKYNNNYFKREQLFSLIF